MANDSPVGLVGIQELCGDISGYLRTDGTISPSWEMDKMALARLPEPMVLAWEPSREVSRIRVHKKVVERFEAAFAEVSDAGLWSSLRVFGGAYNFRLVRGGAKWSTHAFGLSTDHDPKKNPLGALPEDCAMRAEVVAIMEAHDFTWGGSFSGRKDCMHFQFARNY